MWKKAKLYSSAWWKRQQCSSSEEEEVRVSSKWSEQLPLQITQVILQKLCLSDYIRCGAVCPSWRSAAVDMAMARIPFRLAPQLPWLMLATTYCDSSTSAIDHHFLSLSEDHKLYKTNPTYGMHRQLCVGSIEGWLIMLDNVTFTVDQDHTTFNMFNLFFLNPISGAKVMLPPESTIPPKLSKIRSWLHKVVASSVPTSPHCLVASHHSTGRLAFCRPSDKSWTVIDADGEVLTGLEEEFFDIEIIDKKLYVLVMSELGFLFVFDIHLDSSAHTYTAERLVMLHPWPVISLPTPVVRDGVIHANGCEHVTYIFKDSTSKELFMTFISKSYSYKDGEEFRLSVDDPHTDGFRVFKLEHNNGPRWIETTNLGNRILFLSTASRLLVPSVIDLNYFGPYGKTQERNRIYFVFEGGHDFGIFSLTDKSIERYTFPFPEDHYSTRRSPIWFTPNLW